MEEYLTYEGSVENIIFSNESNSYAVFEFYSDSFGLFTCTGTVPYIKAGEFLKVTGIWTTHYVYGEQFKVTAFEKLKPSTTGEILTYLSSGVIPGIREATARKIVNYFLEDTLSVISETPERLAEINGISLKKALKIGKAYEDIRSKEGLILFLHKFGISTNFAVKIYDRFGESAIALIKENPYILCDSVRGISFKTSDSIAKGMGITNENEHRIHSGIKYVLLYSAFSGGHTYLPRDILIKLTVKILEISDLAAENGLVGLLIERELYSANVNGEEGIFLPEFYNSERLLASNLKRLAAMKKDGCENAEKIIRRIEKNTDITLADAQRKAVITAVTSGITVITGGPGTGKTTTIKFIIDVFKDMGKKIALTAPTGRAAKRMTSVTGMEAKTIHRLLEIGFSDDDIFKEFARGSDFPLPYDVIIADEVSMIDSLLMSSLADSLSAGAKLILVGDSDQLPSVGAGNVLSDIIESKTCPVIRLDTVFRQAEESMIVVNAHRINNGEYPQYNVKNKDFFFVDCNGIENIANKVKILVSDRLPKAYGYNPMTDIQVISPMKKTVSGVINLNKILQDTLNPQNGKKNEKVFPSRILRVGDKVMQIKNNYDLLWKRKDGAEEGSGVFNGDMGFISSIDEDSVCVVFDDDKEVTYSNNTLDELELAYAITVHKSQGSEFPVVVMPVFSGAPKLMSRNLFYTAITRASKCVILLGSRIAAQKMVDNDFEECRYSSLDAWLRGTENG
ncbi:MAG: ATP-dependent RecD-like DNA helicase [Ruminococcaceae bacterium]|nr:ATP-dependent RecD-like DNA helicase [Oscillospiraceae bacterium]